MERDRRRPPLLTDDDIKDGLPDHLNLTPAVRDAIVRASESVDAAEEFKSNFLSFKHVLKDGHWTLLQYVKAVHYVAHKLMGKTNRDAYAHTFPERMEDYRKKGLTDKDINSHITGYNRSRLVGKLFAETTTPAWVFLNHYYVRAAERQMEILENPKAGLAIVQRAADSLMTHLKPPETVRIDQGNLDSQVSLVTEYRKAVETMAGIQKKMIEAGADVASIVNCEVKRLKEPVPDAEILPATTSAPPAPETRDTREEG